MFKSKCHNFKQVKIETGISEKVLKLRLPHAMQNLQILTTAGNMSDQVYILPFLCAA